MTAPAVDRDHEAAANTRTWIRLGAACLLLLGLAFIQAPGFEISDTKFDLVTSPGDFLGRGLHLWDEEGAFGQVQNQAYGYLWPMGPFFLLGSFTGVEGWVVQRLWMALVMGVAFLGTARLTRALGVRSDAACIIAGFAFALSPRMITTLGPISIEAWPSALAPWVLLPLVIGSTRGSPRRMALLAAFAVAMVGGVNAVATFAVLPLGVIWLLTRTPGPRRRSMMIWWPTFTLLGTVWWVVPLFLLGSYSPPFLDFIETSTITTFPTGLFDSLRGTSDWVAYIDSTWQGGNLLITEPYIVLNSGLVLMGGLVGIMQRSNPHRTFLLLSVFSGLFLVSMGHVGSVQGFFSQPLQDLLLGPLAPLRNVHKFDPIIRLPLVIGLAFMVQAAMAAVGPTRLDRLASRRLVALAVIGVIGASTPPLLGRMAPTQPILETPAYWAETADWLAARSHDDPEASQGVALLAPGSAFASYLWGSPKDEPLQYEADSRWAVRNAIPLAPPGNIRMLDAFEQRMSQGRGSPGLAPFLRRAGVRYLVVRHDLVRSRDVPDPVLVRQALEDSPGIYLTETFGPETGGDAFFENDGSRLLVNGGWQDSHPAIEIYAVQSIPVQPVSSSELTTVIGGPEDLLDLSDAGLLGDRPTRLGVDVDAASAAGNVAPDGVILTDGMLDRERFFGRVHDGYSAVTTAGDIPRSGNPVRNFDLEPGEEWLTTSRLQGAATLAASTSMSDSNAPTGARPGQLPMAALDGDPESEWVSGFTLDERAWWRIGFEEPLALTEVTVTLGETGGDETDVRIVTDSGSTEAVSLTQGAPIRILLDGEPSRSLQVISDQPTQGQLSLAEVTAPGIDVRRSLVTPIVPQGWGSPERILLRGLLDTRTGCAVVNDGPRCRESQVVASEEPTGFDRVVTLPEQADYQAELTVRPVAGPSLEALILEQQPMTAAASSVAVPDVRASAIAAIDGDPATTWTASSSDLRPRLDLNWIGERRVTAIRIQLDPRAPARRPTSVTVSYPGGSQDVDLGETGIGRIDPVVTDQLAVRVESSAEAASLNTTGEGGALPVGIGEISLNGVPFDPITVDTRDRTWPCGSGPEITIGGVVVPTALTGSPADLYDMEEIPTRVCDSEAASLAAGENLISVPSTTTSVPSRLVLTRAGAPVADPTGGVVAAPVEDQGPVDRTVFPGEATRFVAMRHNENAGWTAQQNGRTLEPVIVDGWRQGWVTDGSSAPVVITYQPDGLYRGSLFVGFLGLLGLFGLLLIPARKWPGQERASLGGRPLAATVLLVGGLLGAGVLGGVGGVGCGVLGVLAGVFALRVGPAANWGVAGLLLIASAAYFARPWGGLEGWAGNFAWPHYLVLVALLGAVTVVAEPAWARSPRSLMNGSSTNR